MNPPFNLDQKALEYAKSGHESVGQKRKYSGEPYIVHPMRVVGILRAAGVTQSEIIQAAYMHDLLEDVFPRNPLYNRQEIQNIFGKRVLALVEELTDEYTPERYPAHNRTTRKGMEATRLSGISTDALKIKLADLIDNTQDIVGHDPGFAKVYLQEKRHILAGFAPRVEAANDVVLTRLFKQATSQIEQ